MTVAAPVATEDIAALDFGLSCGWGLIVQRWIDECTEKPVWGVECPSCGKSWEQSCEIHRDVAIAIGAEYECSHCLGAWKAADLKWYQL